mmetsp:Transcript_33487/g.78475  ORF Transcript_33487/g.78475 Transcript_33487/m.78475 type:complete len:94 (+) Transcript_33487:247-528(+)
MSTPASSILETVQIRREHTTQFIWISSFVLKLHKRFIFRGMCSHFFGCQAAKNKVRVLGGWGGNLCKILLAKLQRERTEQAVAIWSHFMHFQA